MTEKYAVVTRHTGRTDKAPLVHVYGPYPTRKVAQREARVFTRRERGAASVGYFTATAHKIQDIRPQWELLSANAKAFEEFAAPVTPLERMKAIERMKAGPAIQAQIARGFIPVEQAIIPGDRTVPPGTRVWDGPSRARRLTELVVVLACGIFLGVAGTNLVGWLS